jgi:hypothetical protein
MSEQEDRRNPVISYLEKEGLTLIRIGSGDDYRVVDRTRRSFLYEPILLCRPIFCPSILAR